MIQRLLITASLEQQFMLLTYLFICLFTYLYIPVQVSLNLSNILITQF